MTVVTVIFFPIVLLYQGRSFHVFRGRLKGPPYGSKLAVDGAPGGRRPAASQT